MKRSPWRKLFSDHPQRKRSMSTRVKLSPHDLEGVLITFSGIDGSGKTTTIRSVRAYLRSRGIACLVVKMPSRSCRELDYFRVYAANHTVAFQGRIDLTSLCLVCLGDRLMTVRTRLMRYLEKGKWIICDRYIYTALAELLAVGGPRNDLEVLKRVATLFPAPDLAVVTDVPADEAIKRVHRRPSERDRPISRAVYERFGWAFRRVGQENGLALVSTECGATETLTNLRPRLDKLIRSRQGQRLAANKAAR